jgi:hypothetical protein
MVTIKEPEVGMVKPGDAREKTARNPKEAWEKRVYAAINRTPEQLAEARRRAEEDIIPGRPLPPGKTLEDVFVGAIQDNMTEDEVIQALKDL